MIKTFDAMSVQLQIYYWHLTCKSVFPSIAQLLDVCLTFVSVQIIAEPICKGLLCGFFFIVSTETSIIYLFIC